MRHDRETGRRSSLEGRARIGTAGTVSSWRIIMMAAGPTSTTKMPGKMNSTSGKIIFTAV
ncbi:MAG: hypothetical protein U0992_05265 [Planctomycetaceae bacterium]